eukprot:gene11870-11958_t
MPDEARVFAIRAHGDQLRKYTMEPYFMHPKRVARMVENAGLSDEAIAAAWLHDVLEDTDTPYSQIVAVFGRNVAEMVLDLTSPKKDTGNRAARKRVDIERLSRCSADVQTIKVADLIDNSASIIKHDPAFAKIYIPEKRALLDVLTLADEGLRAQAWDIIKRWEDQP